MDDFTPEQKILVAVLKATATPPAHLVADFHESLREGDRLLESIRSVPEHGTFHKGKLAIIGGVAALGSVIGYWAWKAAHERHELVGTAR